MYNGHEILGELLLCGAYESILDHESRSVFLTYPVEEFVGKTAQSISVGDHNFFDTSSHDFVHHP
jgi:hypothetical protein